MTYAVAAVLVAAMALPHVLRLERSAPGAAAAVWLSALVVRALSVLAVAAYVAVVFPGTQVFDAITHWCWHSVLPLVAAHLGLDGHDLGAAAIVVPALILALSVLSVGVGLWMAARAVGRLLQRTTIGEGPRNSLIVGDGDVLVAAAGLRRPRVVVSAGALTSFDDAELAASLEHEHGHIERRHRYLLLVAELCRATARFLPGTRRAARELRIHLERDADRFALSRQHEPLVLASAICKAAGGNPMVAVLALGGGGVARRIRELLDFSAVAPGPRNGRGLRWLAGLMAAVALMLAAALPPATVAAVERTDASSAVRHC